MIHSSLWGTSWARWPISSTSWRWWSDDIDDDNDDVDTGDDDDDVDTVDDNDDVDTGDDDDEAPPGRGNQLLPLHEDVRHWMGGWEVTKGLQGATFQALEKENARSIGKPPLALILQAFSTFDFVSLLAPTGALIVIVCY